MNTIVYYFGIRKYFNFGIRIIKSDYEWLEWFFSDYVVKYIYNIYIYLNGMSVISMNTFWKEIV